MKTKYLTPLFFLFLSHVAIGQVNSNTAIGIGTNIGIGLAGKIKENKKKKAIANSLSPIEINGATLTILRVSEDKIFSDAKSHIIKVQNQLDMYLKACRANKHIDIPYYLEEISILKTTDRDWPVEYYENEYNAYKSYEQELTQKEQQFNDSVLSVKQAEQKRIADSLLAIEKLQQDSLAYAERVNGYHFINSDYTLLKESPSEKSKTIGKIYLGSYIRVLGYSSHSDFVKIALQDIEGYVNNNSIVDNIDKINNPAAEIAVYKSRQYYKYEPDYEYAKPEEDIAYTAPASYTAPKRKKSTASKRSSYTQHSSYITGPRGGCYYITSGGTKVYVDRSYCR